jgi:proteasome lid subunit RPN8/RPN11
MANVGDGNDRYAFDPEAQLALWLALEAAGERPWGVYHSHPTTRAWPSKVDIATAAYPNMVYVIVGADQQVRAFRIIDGQVIEVG